jgi:Asp-tRNA(Asn)/Glu-tRNA(Gln) amidotransferase A subunit family amidase
MSTALLDLSAAEAAAAIDAGGLDAAELFAFYRERAASERLNAFTWVSEEPFAAAPAGAPLAGLPLAVKDLFCTEGVPSQSGSKILEGYRPPYTATVVRHLTDAGATLLGKTNQDEFAMGSSNENSAFGPVLNPWDLTGARRLLRRERGGRRRRIGTVGARHRHRWLDPPAGGVLRDRRPQADLRCVLALRHDRVRLVARSGRSVDA